VAEVEQFARNHENEIRVVGLGTQDTLADAQAFVQEYGSEFFTMLWDESFETWLEIGVVSQPAAVLIAADGEPIQGWIGPFPEGEVLELAAASRDA